MDYLQVGLGSSSPTVRRVITGLTGLRCAGIVLRKPRMSATPVYTDLAAALAATQPAFVLSFAPPRTALAVLMACAEAGVRVLAMASPALSAVSRGPLMDLAATNLVFTANEDPLMPGHAARLEAIRRGLIGEITHVQVSSIDSPHAIALIRAYLGVGIGPAEVRASTFPPPPGSPHGAATIIASVDFTRGKSGLYDFPNDHAQNLFRTQRLLVRGTAGEISGDQVVRLIAPSLITTAYLQRHRPGDGLAPVADSTSAIFLGNDRLWTTPFPDKSWTDDEIAVATLLVQMTDPAPSDGPGPYPLSQALYDARLGQALDEAKATDHLVRITGV